MIDSGLSKIQTKRRRAVGNIRKISLYVVVLLFACSLSGTFAYGQNDDNTKNVLKQGLLGAGVGAISSSASGGNAGSGALIGAGTSVIGSALLDAVTGPSSSSSSRRAPPPQDDYYYADSQDDYYYEEEPPQESGTSKVLKQGLVGAGTGALASGMSGGNAGKGALIGAGTSVIGSALLDAMTTPAPQKRRVRRKAPQQQQQQYQPQAYQQQYQPQPYQQQYQAPSQPTPQNIQVSDEVVGSGEGKKKIVKKYDPSGKLVSEEEIYY